MAQGASFADVGGRIKASNDPLKRGKKKARSSERAFDWLTKVGLGGDLTR
jgi:hypothetical protein